MERPEKITKLAFYLMDKEPLFYLFIINTDFILDEKCFGSEYAAVRYQDNRVKFHYTQKFLELPIRQMYFVIIHEAYHIFKRHLSNHSELSKINHFLVNIAEDAIINTEIKRSIFNGLEPSFEGLEPFFVPGGYSREYRHLGTDANVTPRLFHWYLEKANKDKKELLQKVEFCKNKKTGEYGRIQYELYDNEGTYEVGVFEDLDQMIKASHDTKKSDEWNINDIIPVFINSKDGSFNQAVYDGENEVYGFSDTHDQLKENKEEPSAISQEVFTQKLVRQAREMTENNPQLKKGAGKSTGNSILEKLEKLLKPEVVWKKIFKKYINLYNSNNSLTKEKKKSILTYLMNARSRYGFIFPHYLKQKNKLQKYVFVAVDMSGSCFYDAYDATRFFSEIDNIAEELEFSNSGRVFVLQWDWGITKSFTEYKKGDWKNFEMSGGGSTNPKCIFDYITGKFTPIGSSLFGYIDEEKKNPLLIPDKNKLPLMIVLTDGYFYEDLKKEDLGHYVNNDKNILFITKSKSRIYEGAKVIEYR